MYTSKTEDVEPIQNDRCSTEKKERQLPGWWQGQALQICVSNLRAISSDWSKDTREAGKGKGSAMHV